jgi:hypothetical protein
MKYEHSIDGSFIANKQDAKLAMSATVFMTLNSRVDSMKKAVPQSVRLGFLYGLVIIVIDAILPYRNVQLLQSSEQGVDHTMEALRAADALKPTN